MWTSLAQARTVTEFSPSIPSNPNFTHSKIIKQPIDS